MPTPQHMPCTPWTEPVRLCCDDVEDVSVPCAPGEDVPAEYKWTDEELIKMASSILFERTGRRFPGECEVSLRPCNPCRSCGHGCGCRYEFIPLAGVYPVIEVSEVIIDGVVVPPANYRVDEYTRLVRTDGEHWPRWQDLNADLADTTERTFGITYKIGRAVPESLQYAAALLTCELKRACNGQGCRLPDRVRSVVRDGVSYDIVNPEDMANGGSFGVPLIDTILQDYVLADGKKRPTLTSRLMHPLMDGTRYDRRGVRGE